MVMHRTNHPRLSDGYHDVSESRQIKSLRKCSSPTNNGTQSGHGESPLSKDDSRSPHTLHHKPSYVQRQRERERERDKIRETEKKLGNKPDSSTMHLGPVRHNSSNHDKNKLETFGDWSQQISSSGKKYYYNSKTEVSQWEKPGEWIDLWVTTGKNPFGSATSSNVPLELPDPKQKELLRAAHHNKHHDGMDISPGSTPSGSRTPSPSGQPTSNITAHLISQLAKSVGKPEITAQEALQTLQQALILSQKTGGQNQTKDTSPQTPKKSAEPAMCGQYPSRSQSITTTPVANVSHLPPQATTPLASEPRDLDHVYQSPTEDSDSCGRDTPSPGEGPTALPSNIPSTSLSAAIRPPVANLSPSLANYVNPELMAHVTAWQADGAERQANKLQEDAHRVGSLQSTQVSAELKSARSLVRVQEIQSTLQEQRILFLRQQISDSEESRNQNSFMSS